MQVVKTEAIALQKSVRDDINVMLANYFKDKTAESSALAAQYGRLWQIMSNLNQAGGKRLRSYMVVLAYLCFEGKDQRAILPVAASWELLHLSMLIHDDIIDNDLIRYGVDNVAGSYNEVYKNSLSDPTRRSHHATAAALLAGDLALSAAHDIVLRSDLPMSTKIRAQRNLIKATFVVAGGELLDTEAALYPIMEADPLLIARLKTASYSFIGPLTTGAMLAGASSTMINEMARLGEVLGCAFQLADDLIGVFGDPAVTGKSTTGDLSEGKRTYLLQQTFQSCTEADTAVLNRLIGKPSLSDAEAETLRAIIVRTGAKKQLEDLIAAYAAEARRIVSEIGIPADCRDNLDALIVATTERTY
jgi:geranylgeranyl diphosphate synthase type II